MPHSRPVAKSISRFSALSEIVDKTGDLLTNIDVADFHERLGQSEPIFRCHEFIDVGSWSGLPCRFLSRLVGQYVLEEKCRRYLKDMGDVL